jgi:hypothetical protein
MRALLFESLTITGFVAAMMLLIEYFNVATAGRWRERLAGGRMRQYVFPALLGAMPGCLGAFTVVTLYAHGAVSVGGVVAGMIAASGDEAFVMLALIPKAALVLTAILFVLAVGTGIVVDLIARKRAIPAPGCDALVVHPQELGVRLSLSRIQVYWKDCSAARGVLTTALLLFVIAIAAGQTGLSTWGWERISLLAVAAASLFVVITVPDHFLEEHLWRHVARRHVPRIFFWTLAALAVSGPLERVLRIGGDGSHGHWLLLLMACAIGLIPESGPHLVFVTLYAQHAIPFGILLASSIVQDGHGMLPMLAHSRRALFLVKAINFVVGLSAGAAVLELGF